MYKIKSMINSDFKTKDFSFYISRLKKIAPISILVLGEKFFSDKFPLYFQELQINEEDLTENLLYIPIFLKKYSEKLSIEPWAIELLDYEFSCYQISQETTPFKSSIYTDLTTEIYINPISQALRLEYEIHNYVTGIMEKKVSIKENPLKNKNLLFLSKNTENQKLCYLKGNENHAIIIDELRDGRMIKKGLIQTLQAKFPEVAQREWIMALKDLKSHFVVIEN